jgi:hypothetical protein
VGDASRRSSFFLRSCKKKGRATPVQGRGQKSVNVMCTTTPSQTALFGFPVPLYFQEAGLPWTSKHTRPTHDSLSHPSPPTVFLIPQQPRIILPTHSLPRTRVFFAFSPGQLTHKAAFPGGKPFSPAVPRPYCTTSLSPRGYEW